MRTWRICVRCDVDFDPGGDSLLRVQVDDAEATSHYSCHFRRCCFPFDGDRYCVLDCEIGGKHVEQVKLYASNIVWACFLRQTTSSLFTFVAIGAPLVAPRVAAFSEDRVRVWIIASSLRSSPGSASWLCSASLLCRFSLWDSPHRPPAPP